MATPLLVTSRYYINVYFFPTTLCFLFLFFNLTYFLFVLRACRPHKRGGDGVSLLGRDAQKQTIYIQGSEASRLQL